MPKLLLDDSNKIKNEANIMQELTHFYKHLFCNDPDFAHHQIKAMKKILRSTKQTVLSWQELAHLERKLTTKKLRLALKSLAKVKSLCIDKLTKEVFTR